MRLGSPFQRIICPKSENIDRLEMLLLKFTYGKGAKYGRWSNIENNATELIRRCRANGLTTQEEVRKFVLSTFEEGVKKGVCTHSIRRRHKAKLRAILEFMELKCEVATGLMS